MAAIRNSIDNRPWILIVTLLLGIAGGYLINSNISKTDTPPDNIAHKKEPTIWTCSMHPQIKLPKPGLCPICNMNLITQSDSGGPRELIMSETAKKLAKIQTSAVERKFVETEVRMVGKVAYDETRVKTITAWVGGRLDRLFVDYTGVTVKTGDHMASMYSPKVLVAQSELLDALRAARSTNGGISKESAQLILEASREKLRLWGLSKSQIAAIETRSQPSDHITINAPISGIIIEKMATEGIYVETGTPIYKIADLSQVWVTLNAYESDLPWLRFGQQVEFETRSVPGEVFTGRVAFIDPMLNSKTRTVTVRVNVPNPDYRLKPEMFVRAVVRSKLAGSGKVIEPAMAGKWISPMHPEIIKDEPGSCDICGMPLVPAYKLGFVTPQDQTPPLVIPVSAVLPTGRRAVVYVEVPDQDEPTYRGKEIKLGPRANDYYIVLSGLKEGELVVTNGNFKIDSALQILAKPSMMSMPDGELIELTPAVNTQLDPSEVFSEAFTKQWDAVLDAYLTLQKALASDDDKNSAAATQEFSSAVKQVDIKGLKGKAHAAWMKLLAELKPIHEQFNSTKDLPGYRKTFGLLSEKMLSGTETFGIGTKKVLYQAQCPMALDNRGADWIQETETIKNPYFGARMLTCGSIEKTLKPRSTGKGTSLPATFLNGWTEVLQAYLTLQSTLAKDNKDESQATVKKIETALKKISTAELPSATLGHWKAARKNLDKIFESLTLANDIKLLREGFALLSGELISSIKVLGHPLETPLYRAQCGMAFDGRGADWLQSDKKIKNPYYGKTMLSCGSIEESFAAKPKKTIEPETKTKSGKPEGSHH